MMYQEKLVASVKANGKILREFKDTVYIPFGSEYSILMKNLNDVRCLINVYIDGEKAVDGLVLKPGTSIELERSIVNGNLDEGNKFKFISRSEKIEDHRGIKLEDGFVRIEYQWEDTSDNSLYTTTWKEHDFWNSGPLRGKGIIGDNITCSTTQSLYTSDVGITVPGSISKQKFQSVSSFKVQTMKHILLFRLLGETLDNKPIKTSITTKHKSVCVTCGTKNKATSKFCSECGTGLKIVV